MQDHDNAHDARTEHRLSERAQANEHLKAASELLVLVINAGDVVELSDTIALGIITHVAEARRLLRGIS